MPINNLNDLDKYWVEIREKLNEKYPKLKNEELVYTKNDQGIYQRIAEITGKSEDAIIEELNSYAANVATNRHHSADSEIISNKNIRREQRPKDQH